MSEYTDSQGKRYAIHSHFSRGDVVILGNRNIAWRTDASALAEASPVFKDMFATSMSSAKEFSIPDADDFDITVFISTLNPKHPPAPYTLSQASKAIEMLVKYDCITAAKSLLYQSTEKLQAGQLFTAFSMASRLNDIGSASRILAQGYRWYEKNQPAALSLCPTSSRRPWRAVDAMLIRSDWMWSLTAASEACGQRHLGQAGGLELSSPLYWKDLLGVFISNLTR